MNALAKRLFARLTPLRLLFMIFGVFCCGTGIACFRMSAFGADPCTVMNLGVAALFHSTQGIVQPVTNCLILVIMLWRDKKMLGIGTVVNMLAVGIVADMWVYLLSGTVQALGAGMPLRVALFALGMLVSTFGVGTYLAADLGVAPYDSIAIILEKAFRGRFSFGFFRIVWDAFATFAGAVFCLVAGESVWSILGVGTLVIVCIFGPMVQFFRSKAENALQKRHA